ncbi:MAG: FHA domain-containing protein [Planctomycetota bacterium]|jgi:pSer/pThr/pTyr-binding forkhead associated (FHA) protein
MEPTETSSAEPVLILQTGPEYGKFIPLRADICIGRHPSNEVSIPDMSVSRRHARVEVAGDGVYVHDLGSVNGTFVNGTPVTDKRRVRNGDKIRVGQTDFSFKQD